MDMSDFIGGRPSGTWKAAPRAWAIGAGLWLIASLAFGQAPDWRTWTSTEGSEIEAYLKEVSDGQIVIVRRDGREFATSINRFSEADRQYVAEYLRQQLPSPRDFRAADFSEVDLPDRHRIEDVPHVRQRGRETLESAAIRMVLDFHNISYGEALAGQIDAMATHREVLLAPRDLQNALRNLPVETEIVRASGGEVDPDDRIIPDEEEWEITLNAIRTAISWDLPVIIAYRTRDFVDAPPAIAVAIGYERQRLNVLDPAGGRSAVPLDMRDLALFFEHALVIFPTATGVVDDAPEETSRLTREFLSAVSTGIRQAPEFTPTAVAGSLESSGLRVEIQDVNRTDLQSSQGQTRSFAREALEFVKGSLEQGRVVVLPQEIGNDATAFVLIYGIENGDYLAVEFSPNRSFQRRTLSPSDLASRWPTREGRQHRLYLIEVEAGQAETTRETTKQGSGDDARANEDRRRRQRSE